MKPPAAFKAPRPATPSRLQEVDRLKALLVSSEASEKLAEKKLSDATIRAPFPGSIKTRDVHPGEYLRVQGPVMVLVRTDTLRARLAVPERWAGSVRDGATVDLQVEAFPGETFHGRVSRINPAVAQDSRTFEDGSADRQRRRPFEARLFRAGVHPQREGRENHLSARKAQ